MHPDDLAPSAGTDQLYTYTNFGTLSTVKNVLGNVFGFFYDDQGRLDSLAFPNGSGFETRTYDNDGRMIARYEKAGSDVLHDDDLTYDRAGRITDVEANGGSAWGRDVVNVYDGLGRLVASDNLQGGGVSRSIDESIMDGQGNTVFWTQPKDIQNLLADPVRRYEYLLGGRLDRIIADYDSSADWRADTTKQTYDDAGNTRYSWRRYWVPQSMPSAVMAVRSASASYFATDQRMMFHQVNRDSTNDAGSSVERRGAFEEYWYDALGRRVLTRSRVDADSMCESSTYCKSYVDRYVWDGDQLLYELRIPGDSTANLDLGPTQTGGDYKFYGRTGYTHGPGIDAPLDLLRHQYNGSVKYVIPHANYRGAYDSGSDSTGALVGCTTYGDNGCLAVQYPAKLRGSYHSDEGGREWPEWFGSLIQDKRDASGLMYMRNRYYDPSTGQFTQQDPIGLAGGLNLYGFAGGDPVNFWDPFGLCEDEQGNVRDCTVTFLSTADLDGVDPNAHAALIQLAQNADVDLIVYSAVRQRDAGDTRTGCAGSNHYCGQAFDIVGINNKIIGADDVFNPQGDSELRSLVWRVQFAASHQSGIRENYGPVINQKNNNVTGQMVFTPRPGQAAGHQDHIHVSYRYP